MDYFDYQMRGMSEPARPIINRGRWGDWTSSLYSVGSAIFTPSRRLKRGRSRTPSPVGDRLQDRFALTSPCRTAAAHALRSPIRARNSKTACSDDEGTTDDTYTQLLRSEIFETPSKKRSRIIAPREVSPTPASKHIIDTPTSNRYRRTALTREGQRLIESPRRGNWEIPKSPYKILDAPELQDDYYLNLIDWSPSDILGVGLGSCVYLWTAASSKVIKLCDLGPSDSVTSVGWHHKGTHLAIGTDSGLVQLWDIEREKKIRQFEGHTKRVGTLAWNENVLSSGSRDKSIQHRDVRQSNRRNAVVETWEHHSAEVCGLKWDLHEGNMLASGGNDNSLLIWDKRHVANGPMWTPDNPHAAAVKALTWSPHRPNTIASGGGTADRKIKIWNVQNQSCIKQVDTSSQVCNLAWSKQTEHLISTHGYSHNHITIWDQTDGGLKEATRLTGHTTRVVYLAMSPDGQSIVTGAGDETLRFWKICNAKKGASKRGPDTTTCVI
ncbi:WD domain, G-beta repeat-containing protein [Geranomyces variabilis]|nr:WD domain, G-beta repeat-containing protein [Geranomyces variabilis]KAJ3141163.1 substrate-specific activator of APC-dependent proteolysis [Geranomyces variabilis]